MPSRRCIDISTDCSFICTDVYLCFSSVFINSCHNSSFVFLHFSSSFLLLSPSLFPSLLFSFSLSFLSLVFLLFSVLALRPIGSVVRMRWQAVSRALMISYSIVLTFQLPMSCTTLSSTTADSSVDAFLQCIFHVTMQRQRLRTFVIQRRQLRAVFKRHITAAERAFRDRIGYDISARYSKLPVDSTVINPFSIDVIGRKP